MTNTAISAQGSTLSMSTGTGSPITVTTVIEGNPTILTAAAHGLSNGDVVTLAGFSGTDAALLNGKTVVVTNVTTNTFAVNIDTTGKTITTTGTPTATPQTYTPISNITTFNGLDGQPSDIDVTNLDSAAKEFRPGLVDNGAFSFNVMRDTDDPGQIAVDAARVAGTVKTFKLVLPNAATATFDGYVKKFPLSGGVDKVLETAVDVRVTGAVTWS
jgi:hypothetical protein